MKTSACSSLRLLARGVAAPLPGRVQERLLPPLAGRPDPQRVAPAAHRLPLPGSR